MLYLEKANIQNPKTFTRYLYRKVTYLFGKVIRKQTEVRECPTKDIVDQKDGGIFVAPSNVRITTSDLASLTGGSAIPRKA